MVRVVDEIMNTPGLAVVRTKYRLDRK